MLRRIGWAFALVGLTSLGNWGCATPSDGSRAPLSLGPWTAPGGLLAKPATSTQGVTFPAGDISTVSAPTTSTHWWQTYRPGSLISKWLKPAPAATTTAAKPTFAAPTVASSEGFSDETLAGIFPTMYGAGNVEPARLAHTSQPRWFGRSANASPENSRLAAMRRPAADRAEATSTLPAGMPVQAAQGAPNEVQLTGREEAAAPGDARPTSRKPKRAPAAPVELTPPAGASAPPDQAARKIDPADALSTDLQLESSPARSRDDAPSDPAGRTTSATVETPPATPRRETSQPLLSVEDPLLAGRPRMGRARPMVLPPPEFPATYHTEGVRAVVREGVPARRAPNPEPDPRKPLFPRLSRLIWGPDTTAPQPVRAEESRTAN